MLRRIAPSLCLAALAACSDRPDSLVAPDFHATNASSGDRTVALCHLAGSDGTTIEVSTSALQAHMGHGDHIARFEVDPAHGALGDGIHFARIGDAVAAARDIRVARGELERAACRITIVVAPGTFRGSVEPSSDPSLERFPLVLDFPDVTLQGALDMVQDAFGRATGVGEHGETILTPFPGLISVSQFSEPLIVVNGHPGGFQGHGVTIEGFVFQSGHTDGSTSFGGQGILSLRVRDLLVRGNRFDALFSESVDLRASSGQVERNHLGGGAGTCDICLAGPGSYRAEGNRLLAGGIPGILIVPATLLPVPPGTEQFILPSTSLVTAIVVNNEVRDHLRVPVGVGVRVATVGIGAPNVAGEARVEVRNNTLVNNRFAVIVEAGFPVAGTTLRGDVALTLANNVLTQSCQADLLVSLSRHTTGLGLSNLPYLRNSVFRLDLGGNTLWENAWYSHPDGFGNTLVVDGAVIPNGAQVAYDPTRLCIP
jgi:hypothetical protein